MMAASKRSAVGHSIDATEQRHAAVRAALAEIKALQGLSVPIDDGALDFLAGEVSEQVL